MVKRSAYTIHSNVQELFPNDKLLGELGVEGYVGRPLFSTTGKVIGLMVYGDSLGGPCRNPHADTRWCFAGTVYRPTTEL